MKRQQLIMIIGAILVLMGGVSRIVNHEMGWYNFAPITALGLFCGSIFPNKRYAFLMAIGAQLLGDMYLFFRDGSGFYGLEQLFVYGGLLLVTLLGTFLHKRKPLTIFGYSIAASMLFFILSNLGVWVVLMLGKQDVMGYGTGLTALANTYVAAIPFLERSIVADLLGSALFFGSFAGIYQLIQSKKLQLLFAPKKEA